MPLEVKVLLESSLDSLDDKNGGAVSKMRSMLPAAKLYHWGNKSKEFAGGRVHSKIAVSKIADWLLLRVQTSVAVLWKRIWRRVC